MNVNQILQEIEKSHKVIEAENNKIAELTRQLQGATFDDWDWITVKQGADSLGVSVAMVYRKINSGDIDVKRFGGKTFVKASELKRVND